MSDLYSLYSERVTLGSLLCTLSWRVNVTFQVMLGPHVIQSERIHVLCIVLAIRRARQLVRLTSPECVVNEE